jgi:aspartyl-tRNA(Asn)/glutamyl-tRNA(Gln) amidotransferase subunit A
VSSDPTELTISEARRELGARRLSPVELVTATLDRIDRLNDQLRAYLHVDAEAALAAARREERELERDAAGPLAGIPICVKDVIDAAGLPTTAGANGWSRRPTADAPAVARLRQAGAIVVGKGNTNEFAFGIDGQNPHWGSCRNPHDPTRISGGSSAGPACATAAGLALAGIGTDASGSLRVPASLCGLVAIRPTHGLVPTAGVVPLAWSYDTIGPLARTVADARLLLETMAGPRRPGEDGADADPARGRKLGLLTQFLGAECEREIADATCDAATLLESLGAEVRPIELPRFDEIDAIHRLIQFSEAAAVHRPWIDDQRPRYEPAVRDRLEAGAAIPAEDYLLAQRARRLLAEETAWAMDGIDALIGPTTPIAAPPLGAEEVQIYGRAAPLRPTLLAFTEPLSQFGTPVVAVPLRERDGLPYGLQLMGRPDSEALLCDLAAAYRRAAAGEEAEP